MFFELSHHNETTLQETQAQSIGRELIELLLDMKAHRHKAVKENKTVLADKLLRQLETQYDKILQKANTYLIEYKLKRIFDVLKPFNHNRLEPLYLIWVKNVVENRLSRGYWELSLSRLFLLNL